MLTRRQFLGGIVVLVATPFAWTACSSDEDDGGGCNGVAQTSSIAAGHSHTVCVPATDLQDPPPTGRGYTTTMTDGHVHTLALTQAQLRAVEAGDSVDVITSVANDHTHGFTIARADAAIPLPTPVPIY